ncbi:TetR/AcrR family transcriptional regulator [Steroidobacter sp. S1-65]|uniref:TetR/AcrR family transcriptional regulator n=1 Tax=Steroidobacter gossypii TaxID=2805490 RepID=A0ABS1WV90_9GAMM|nr:TetR/AcrR family transcriptional regulator [Steroidobacter gossypii]MBM0104873.1 TetR/AcrR family transcriptional regulator [Steroidobacter gossypii]
MKTRSPTTTEKKAETTKAKRLAPEVRRAQMLDAAAKMIVEQGYLPLPVEELARQVGASKGLIYAYFPSQYDLFNALLEREIHSLSLGGLDTASQVQDLEQAAVLCAMLYFEHVARSGPLLNILMTDLYMAGHLSPQVRRSCEQIAERLTRLAASQLPCSREEIHAAIEMMTAIPDEAGRLVFHRELDQTTARQICHSLILSCLKALRAPEKVKIPD